MTKNEIIKPTSAQKFGVIIGVIVIIFVGYFIGSVLDAIIGIYGVSLIGALVGARIGSKMLKNKGVISANSPWVKENKGLAIAKYIVLAVIVIALVLAFIYLT